jgi:hypothetical protein
LIKKEKKMSEGAAAYIKVRGKKKGESEREKETNN